MAVLQTKAHIEKIFEMSMILQLAVKLDLCIYFLNGLNPYESTDMARWQDPINLETICTIVKTLTPTWSDGLHPVQLKLVSKILDGQDILYCTTTGDGKLLKLVCQLLFVTFLRLPQSRLAR